MTTEVGQRSRHRPQLLLLAVLVVAAVALLGYLRLSGDGGDPSTARTSATVAGASPAPTTEAPQSPVAIELTQRLTTYLESLPPTKHAGHGGHSNAGTKATTVCGVRVYGYEPAAAGSADDVTKVYGFHLCGVAEPGLDWDWAPKLVAPVIVSYDGAEPKIQMVEATPKVPYQERLHQLFPPQYLQAASRGLESQATMDELRRRYDAAAAKT